MASARRTIPALAAAAALLLAGCSAAPEQAEATSESQPPSATPTPEATPPAPVQPVGDPQVVAQGLPAPWSVVALEDGTLLVSGRDDAVVREVLADGSVREAGSVPGVDHGGEGGLLGLAAYETGTERWLYAMLTTAGDNRIVRMPLAGEAGAVSIGVPEEILVGLPRASNHNGGRIAFGPDGMLYATAGDAAQTGLAQDAASLAGKILRMQPDGSAPADNPTSGSLVYSMGHRNPQGIAWTEDGQLWASEFGQDTWDELNRIEAGGNYGWPTVEGQAGDPAFIDPVAQWATDDASPSGLAAAGSTLLMASLRGERLWVVQADGSATAFYEGGLGRIRDAVIAPDGTLLLLTNNTDGRGDPREGDDRLLRVALGPVG